MKQLELLEEDAARDTPKGDVGAHLRKDAIIGHQRLIRSSSVPLIPSGDVPDEGGNHWPSACNPMHSVALRSRPMCGMMMRGNQHVIRIRGHQSSAHHEWDDDERIVEHEAFSQLHAPQAARRDDQDELEVQQPARKHLMRDAISGHQWSLAVISGHQWRPSVDVSGISVACEIAARSHLHRIFAHHREEHRDRFRMHDELPT